jgi:hypothetical protein
MVCSSSHHSHRFEPGVEREIQVPAGCSWPRHTGAQGKLIINALCALESYGMWSSDVDPNQSFRFDADPDSTPSFTHVGKSNKIMTFNHSSANTYVLLLFLFSTFLTGKK